MPNAVLDRLQAQYGLSARDAAVLVSLGEGTEQADGGVRYFEAVAEGRDGQASANWCVLFFLRRKETRLIEVHRVIHELVGQLAKAQLSLAESPVAPAELGALVDAVSSAKLTGSSFCNFN